MNDLLLESLGTPEQIQFSQNIRSSAAQLLVVINDVLDISKIESGRLDIEAVPFQICLCLERLHSMMLVQATSKNLVFEYDNIDVPEDMVVIGDPHRLQQILLNLVSNSIKFTQAGKILLRVAVVGSGRIDRKLDTETTIGQDSQLKASPASPSDNNSLVLRFAVEDTGCGMDDATMQRMFEAFSQADSSTARKYGGTGLGLTITRQLVEMMGGTIRFSSKTSVGTCGTVEIAFKKANQGTTSDSGVLSSYSVHHYSRELTPTAQVKRAEERGSKVHSRAGSLNEPPPPQPPPPPSMQVQAITNRLSKDERKEFAVLIVEDNVINLQIAVLMTKKLGPKILIAGNGAEALAMLEKASRTGDKCPDLILMDCMMPIMDGYEATRALRQDHSRFSSELRTIPIVALTASAHPGDMARCLEAGMDEYLVKPVAKKELEDVLDRWIPRRRRRGRKEGEGEEEVDVQVMVSALNVV